jgi:hypothetical protein
MANNTPNNRKKIFDKIDQYNSNYGRARQAIHTALVLSVEHVQLHGDGRPLLAAMAALQDVDKRQVNQVNLWLKAFSPVRAYRVGDDTAKAGELKGKAREKANAYDLDAADQNPFWTMERESRVTYVKPSSVVKFALEGARKRLIENVDGEHAKLACDAELAEMVLAKIEAVFADDKFLEKLTAVENAFIAEDKAASIG